MIFRTLTSVLLALACAATANAETVAITGATIHTLGPQGTMNDATLLIDDDRIRAVGEHVTIPSGARIINAAGAVVTPGIFDPFGQLGIVEISLVPQTVDMRQSGERHTASFDVADAVNPRSALISYNRSLGVTRAMVAPLPAQAPISGSPVRGRGAIIHLGGSSDSVLVAHAALFVSLGEEGSGVSGGARSNALLLLREALEDARDYDANRAAFLARERRDYAYSRMDLEALVPALAGEIPVVVTAHRASDINVALRLADEFRLRLIINGGTEAWMVARALASARVPVILDAAANLPGRFEALGATLENAARLHAAGVTIAISERRTHQAGNVTQSAGIAVSYGLPYEAALRAIMLNPAVIYGQDGVTGTLEAGKDADVVIWDGDPLEVTSAPSQVFVRGVAMAPVSRQSLLRDRYRDLNRDWPPAYYQPE